MSDIDSKNRKKLLIIVRKSYKLVRDNLKGKIDDKSMVGLMGFFSIAIKLVKHGTQKEYQLSYDILTKLRIMVVSGIIPEDIMIRLDNERAKLPESLANEVTDGVIKSMLEKFNNPVVLGVLDELIMGFNDALQ